MRVTVGPPSNHLRSPNSVSVEATQPSYRAASRLPTHYLALLAYISYKLLQYDSKECQREEQRNAIVLHLFNYSQYTELFCNILCFFQN